MAHASTERFTRSRSVQRPIAPSARALHPVGARRILAVGARRLPALGARRLVPLGARRLLVRARRLVPLGSRRLLALGAARLVPVAARRLLALGARRLLALDTRRLLLLGARRLLPLGALGILAACSLPASRGGAVPAESAARRALADADTLRVRDVAPGVRYVYAWRSTGPWGINVLEVDGRVCAADWEARKMPGVDSRATTSSLGAGDLAAVNGDFFAIPAGTPVNAFVHEGLPWIGPSSWPAWILTGRRATIGTPGFRGGIVAGGDTLRLSSLNRAPVRTTAYHPAPDGATLFTTRVGKATLGDSAATLLWLDDAAGDERAGGGRSAATEALPAAEDTAARRADVPAGRALLVLRGGSRAWAKRHRPGERVRWWTAVLSPAGDVAREVVGGFPVLLRNGQPVEHGGEVRPSFGETRHPRSAIGWSADGTRTFLVVVDGRQESYSGMSLPELAALMRELGAAEALNLDGGGSSAMVVRGSVVSHPSDRDGERPVGDALALAGCAR